ncbi:MAG: EI24 domain-containing protein [Bacteroidota bacterium]
MPFIIIMLKDFIISIQSYFKAHELIKTHKLWKWILIPGLIYAVLFTVSMYFFSKSANAVINWLNVETGLQKWLTTLDQSWIGFLFTIGGIIIWIILMLLYFSMFKYIWLILGAPVFSFLTQRTISILEQTPMPVQPQHYIELMVDGIKMAARNTVWQTIYVIAIIFISMLPLLGWATPLLAGMVECYFYGFSMLNYSFEKFNSSNFNSSTFINQHRGLAIGNGMVFYLMHCIVFVGWIFAPAYAVVAATITMHEVKITRK